MELQAAGVDVLWSIALQGIASRLHAAPLLRQWQLHAPTTGSSLWSRHVQCTCQMPSAASLLTRHRPSRGSSSSVTGHTWGMPPASNHCHQQPGHQLSHQQGGSYSSLLRSRHGMGLNVTHPHGLPSALATSRAISTSSASSSSCSTYLQQASRAVAGICQPHRLQLGAALRGSSTHLPHSSSGLFPHFLRRPFSHAARVPLAGTLETAAAARAACRAAAAGMKHSMTHISEQLGVRLAWPQLVLPTWPGWWPAWEALYRSSVESLPSLPGIRVIYLHMLGALNVSHGAGTALLCSAALTAAELSRETRTARAQGFETVPQSMLVENTAPLGFWQTVGWWCASYLYSAMEAALNIARALWLALIFTPLALSAPLALQLGLYRAEWMELLRRTLEAGGPAFIKWGQWAATRHDLFPPDFCSELELLHSQAPAHRFRHTQRAIASAFGMKHAELFDWIEREPVASGSIGQIHRARLSAKGAALTGCETGQLVAVKVRHPGVADTILRDFSTMLGLAHLAALLPALQHLRLEDTLEQFAAPLKEQVDLAREASNLQRFNYNFRNTPAVQFPVPLYPLVSSGVLVETYEEGDHISRYIASNDSPINHRLSLIGSGTMLQMMLMDNLIHSDLHPGNILVRLAPPEGLLGTMYTAADRLKRSSMVSNQTRARLDNLQQRWLQPQMVLLDVGMATELSDEDQRNMVGLFRAFAAMDGLECGQWTLRFSGAQQKCPDPEAFTSAMAATFDELRRLDEGANWGDTQFRNSADTLSHVLELVRQYKVTLPGHICAVVVTTMVLEGWSNKLDPDHSVLSQVQKMFAATNVPWRTRLVGVVDEVMETDSDTLVDLAT